MKKILLLPLISLCLSGCGLFDGGSSSEIHQDSYEAITGKFVLYENLDKRYSYTDTYFDIDGSKGNFSLKYYENGVLKKEGIFQRVVVKEQYIHKFRDVLHFNVKCGNTAEHISTYTESLDPVNQFRIIEEYHDNDKNYFLSELPFVMGTYVREGETYQEETLDKNETNYLLPTLDVFTSALNGFYKLDEDHYFYFLFPGINYYYAFSYFQYYSSELDKPLEGVCDGKTFKSSGRSEIFLSYSRQVLFYKVQQDTEKAIMFGYIEHDEKDNSIEHFGTIDFSNGTLNSFTFEHLSRYWTDEEWDEYTKNEEYHLPDPINYDYVGGTYSKE